MPKTILAALCALLLSAITPAQLTPPPVFATSPIYDTFEFALVSSAILQHSQHCDQLGR